MRKLAFVIALTAMFVFFASAAEGAPPERFTFAFHDQFVDTECGFPIAVDVVFTNDATEFRDAAGIPAKLQLHQSTVGTLSANGKTLRWMIRETIMIDFAGGIPVAAKHVGQLEYIGGAGAPPVFHRTGQAAFEVVFDPDRGFYVDGPLTARHGLRDDFDLVTYCAAFS